VLIDGGISVPEASATVGIHATYGYLLKKKFEDGLLTPTFAIRAKKRLFLDICRLGTIDFTEVDFKNSL